MTNISPQRPLNTKAYHLSQRDRVCGYLAEGRSCPTGPAGNGECRVDSICVPWHDGSRWHCTRIRAFGGRCSEGPIPDANCPNRKAVCPHRCPPCHPVRSLRSKRRLVTGLTAAAALGFCLVILGGGSGDSGSSTFGTATIISPGPLSAQHAATDQGCAACHSAAEKSPLDLLSCAVGQFGGIEESLKCLECHPNFGEYALLPHSIDPAILLAAVTRPNLEIDSTHHTAQQLLARTLFAHKTTDAGELACATCHQEHRGADFDLTAMTNARCQSCHSSTFHSFSDGHPEFSERKRARLHFDHVTHMMVHFQNFERLMPNGQPRMQCSDCHTPDSGGAMMNLATFDFMCASCHSPQIRDFDSLPPARLHELTFIDAESDRTATNAGSPFVELMLESSPPDETSLARLVSVLTNDGPEMVRHKLHFICNLSTNTALVEACVSSLQESGFFDVISKFGSPDPGLDAIDLRYGNWRLTHRGTKLIYDGSHHADALLRSWIDLVAANVDQYPDPPADDSAGAFDRFFRDLVSPESTGRCLKCHTIDRDPSGSFVVNWQSQHGQPTARGFTRFSHKPHLTLLSSHYETAARRQNQQRCETCHALDDDDFRLVNSAFALDDGMPAPAGHDCSALGVNSVRRGNCVQCHMRNLAGDNCLRCHNYHIHPDALRAGRSVLQ